MQKRRIDELEREIIWCKNQLSVREAMIENQNGEILKLQREIIQLEETKKKLLEDVKPLIHTKSSKRKEP